MASRLAIYRLSPIRLLAGIVGVNIRLAYSSPGFFSTFGIHMRHGWQRFAFGLLLFGLPAVDCCWLFMRYPYFLGSW